MFGGDQYKGSSRYGWVLGSKQGPAATPSGYNMNEGAGRTPLPMPVTQNTCVINMCQKVKPFAVSRASCF